MRLRILWEEPREVTTYVITITAVARPVPVLVFSLRLLEKGCPPAFAVRRVGFTKRMAIRFSRFLQWNSYRNQGRITVSTANATLANTSEGTRTHRSVNGTSLENTESREGWPIQALEISALLVFEKISGKNLAADRSGIAG